MTSSSAIIPAAVVQIANTARCALIFCQVVKSNQIRAEVLVSTVARHCVVLVAEAKLASHGMVKIPLTDKMAKSYKSRS